MSHSTLKDKARDKLSQRLYAATKPQNATPGRTFVNSVMEGSYTGNSMGSSRDGANAQPTSYGTPA